MLSYSPERQKRLIGALGLGEFDWVKLMTLMFGAGAIVMAAMMIPLLLNRQTVDPASRMYRVFCRRLARFGIVGLPHEGTRALRTRVAASRTLSAAKKAAAVRFLIRYETLQYGTVGTDRRRVALAHLNSLLADCQ